MPNINPFSLKIGGQAGQGIKSAGVTFAKLAARSGYHLYDSTEYPSLIRGGHNIIQTVVSSEEVFSAVKYTNFLVALNQETIDLHKDELTERGGLLFDSEKGIDTAHVRKDCRIFPVPLAKIAKQAGDQELLGNMVALGATIALLGGKLEYLLDLISEEFSDKAPGVIEINQAAAKGGYEAAKSSFPEGFSQTLSPKENVAPRIVVNGNEGVALGAIAAGLGFAAIYPMSPISSILHILAAHQGKFGYLYEQPEDEIAAINMAIGASFAGARAMVATSGGGFCLMTEGYGLAGMTETPLVIVEGMRGGPATGLPTWSSQGDLRFVLHAHQDDFPRLVLAPGDAQETFFLTMQAFNLADKYQTPVVLLIDKNICENGQSFSLFDYSPYQVERGSLSFEKIENYRRYELADDGISPRSVPGAGNFFVANSDEHDPLGFSSEKVEDRESQMAKRMKKLGTCALSDMQPPQLFGPDEADVTLISWGSNKGAIRAALKKFPSVNYLHLTWVNPFPSQAVQEKLAKARHVIDVESNFSGQMAGWILEKTGIEIKDKFLKYDGRPFYPEEISEKIASVLKK